MVTIMEETNSDADPIGHSLSPTRSPPLQTPRNSTQNSAALAVADDYTTTSAAVNPNNLNVTDAVVIVVVKYRNYITPVITIRITHRSHAIAADCDGRRRRRDVRYFRSQHAHDGERV